MKKMVFYMDECHNTGNNWLDNDQPYFTYGGWLIEETYIEKAKCIVKEFRNQHQGNELKSKSFTSSKGIQKVIRLSEDLINKCFARPYYICMDKKYMIACKAVEAFFNHEYNKNVNGFLTFPNEHEYIRVKSEINHYNYNYNDINDMIQHNRDKIPPINDTKKGLADFISSNEDLCAKIGNIINDKFNEDINAVIMEMTTLFKNKGLDNVCNGLQINNINISDILEELRPYEEGVDSEPRKILFLVKPCLYEMISNLKAEYENFELVVDTLGESNFLIEEIAKILKISIDIKDSKQDEMIMASDLLVGQIARIIKDITSDSTSVKDEHLRLLNKTFVPKTDVFLSQAQTMWFFKFSFNNWKRLCNKLKYDVIETDYYDILKNNFNYFNKDRI
jgi:hypothetical protein